MVAYHISSISKGIWPRADAWNSDKTVKFFFLLFKSVPVGLNLQVLWNLCTELNYLSYAYL